MSTETRLVCTILIAITSAVALLMAGAWLGAQDDLRSCGPWAASK